MPEIEIVFLVCVSKKIDLRVGFDGQPEDSKKVEKKVETFKYNEKDTYCHIITGKMDKLNFSIQLFDKTTPKLTMDFSRAESDRKTFFIISPAWNQKSISMLPVVPIPLEKEYELLKGNIKSEQVIYLNKDLIEKIHSIDVKTVGFFFKLLLEMNRKGERDNIVKAISNFNFNLFPQIPVEVLNENKALFSSLLSVSGITSKFKDNLSDEDFKKQIILLSFGYIARTEEPEKFVSELKKFVEKEKELGKFTVKLLSEISIFYLFSAKDFFTFLDMFKREDDYNEIISSSMALIQSKVEKYKILFEDNNKLKASFKKGKKIKVDKILNIDSVISEEDTKEIIKKFLKYLKEGNDNFDSMFDFNVVNIFRSIIESNTSLKEFKSIKDIFNHTQKLRSSEKEIKKTIENSYKNVLKTLFEKHEEKINDYIVTLEGITKELFENNKDESFGKIAKELKESPDAQSSLVKNFCMYRIDTFSGINLSNISKLFSSSSFYQIAKHFLTKDTLGRTSRAKTFLSVFNYKSLKSFNDINEEDSFVERFLKKFEGHFQEKMNSSSVKKDTNIIYDIIAYLDKFGSYSQNIKEMLKKFQVTYLAELYILNTESSDETKKVKELLKNSIQGNISERDNKVYGADELIKSIKEMKEIKTEASPNAIKAESEVIEWALEKINVKELNLEQNIFSKELSIGEKLILTLMKYEMFGSKDHGKCKTCESNKSGIKKCKVCEKLKGINKDIEDIKNKIKDKNLTGASVSSFSKAEEQVKNEKLKILSLGNQTVIQQIKNSLNELIKEIEEFYLIKFNVQSYINKYTDGIGYIQNKVEILTNYLNNKPIKTYNEKDFTDTLDYLKEISRYENNVKNENNSVVFERIYKKKKESEDNNDTKSKERSDEDKIKRNYTIISSAKKEYSEFFSNVEREISSISLREIQEKFMGSDIRVEFEKGISDKDKQDKFINMVSWIIEPEKSIIHLQSILNVLSYLLGEENIRDAYRHLLEDFTNTDWKDEKVLTGNSFGQNPLKVIFEKMEEVGVLIDETKPEGQIISILSRCPQILKFLFEMPVDTIKGLFFVLDLNSGLNVDNISQALNAKTTLDKLKSYSEDALLGKLKGINAKAKDDTKINDYSAIQTLPLLETLYSKFEELKKELDDKSGTKKNKIFEFLKNSTVTYELIEETKIRNSEECFSFSSDLIKDEEEFQELSKRSNLLRTKEKYLKNEKGEENKEAIECNQNFRNYSEAIRQLSKQKTFLNQMYSKGCLFYRKVVNTIQTNKTEKGQQLRIASECGNNEEDIKTFNKTLKNRVQDMEQMSKDFYDSSFLLTFFYGRQFSKIYEAIRDSENGQVKNPGELCEVLSILTNNKKVDFEEAIRRAREIQSNADVSAKEVLGTVNRFLEELSNTNSEILDTKQIFKNCIVNSKEAEKNVKVKLIEKKTDQESQENLKKNNDEDKIKKGVYFTYFNDSLELEVLKLSFGLTSSHPKGTTLFYCNDQTSREEILPFIYRATECPEKVLFILSNYHNLKKYLIKEINEILREKEFKAAVLVFVFPSEVQFKSEEKDKLPSPLDYCGEIKTISDSFKDQVKNHATVLSSDCSGVGKTYCTRKEYGKKNYFVLPFGSEITKDGIITRLKEFKISQGCVLHIILYDSYSKYEQINDCLFSIIFTKFLSTTINFCYLPDDLKIFIEIPFGFFSFKKKAPVLNLFNEKIFELSNTKSDLDKGFEYKLKIISAYSDYWEQEKLEKHLIDADKLPEINSEALSKIFTNKDNYYKRVSMVNLLSHFLTQFSNNPYLGDILINNLKNKSFMKKSFMNKGDRKGNPRTKIYEQFLELSKVLSSSCYQNIGDTKYFNCNDGLENEREKAFQFYITSEKLEFDKLPPGFLIINKDGASISIITNARIELEENKKLKEDLLSIWNSQSMKVEDALPNYVNQKDITEFIKKRLKIYFDIKGELSNEITEGCAFTPDNFFKIILIYLKISLGIPILLMGETGCGKTFLIKKLFQLERESLKGEKKKNFSMQTLSVHAGVTEEKVIEFMNERIKEAESNSKSTIWVFFDEINTSSAVGLMSEIMCNKTMRGKSLPSNLNFIAACNKFRKKTSKDTYNNGLVYKRKYKNKDLAYNVLPLPHSLLNFTFDFGSLDIKDEEKYINEMVESIKRKQGKSAYYKMEEATKQMALNMLIACHEFFKAKEISNVSLRDSRRFTLFYPWFMESITKQIEYDKTAEIDDVEKQEICVIISIHLCYLLRLSIKEHKDELLKKLVNSIKGLKLKKKYSTKDFETIIRTEEDRLTKKFEFGNDIALNEPLRQNLFALFNCVMKRVPIFICGKPGCSKSLSVKILSENLQGNSSKNEYFKSLPVIVLVPYQGSFSSSSEEIEECFKKAERINEQSDKKKTIAGVFIDEMGLAEISDKNPLKILHFYLDFENEDDDDEEKGDGKETKKSSKKIQVPFIGISNWNLDASKQNRGIFISRPDPSEEDLVETAKQISKSFSIPDSDTIFENLAKCYFEFKNQFQSENLAKLLKSKEHLDELVTVLRNKEQLETIVGKTTGDNENKKRKLIDLLQGDQSEKIREKIRNSLPEDQKSTEKIINNIYIQEKYAYLEDFFGTRDFYSLIKYICKMKKKRLEEKRQTEEFEDEILIRDGLERNFRGSNYTSFENFKELKSIIEIYSEKYKREISDYDVKKCIQKNVEETDSRYLLLISNSSIPYFILNNTLKQRGKNYYYLVGSQFKNDIESQEYAYHQLNQILFEVEEGNFLIFQNFESIYPSLYDLFNQNFMNINGQDYAKVSVGMANNPQVQVNKNFRCAILLEEDNILNQDPPFLNRFEKHFIKCETLLNKREDSILFERIYKVIEDLKEIAKEDLKPLISFEDQLINCTKEEIYGLIYKSIKGEAIYEPPKVQLEITCELAKSFSQDLLAFSYFSKLNNSTNKQIFDKMIKTYQEYEVLDLPSFIQKTEKRRNVIYTFSKLYERCKVGKGQCKLLSREFSEANVVEIEVSDFKSSQDIEIIIKKFYEKLYVKEEEDNDKDKFILILKFEPSQMMHLNLLTQIVNNIRKSQYTDENEGKELVIFIVQLKRVFKNQGESIARTTTEKVWLSRLNDDFDQRFVDNLDDHTNNKAERISFVDLIKNSNLTRFIQFNDFIDKLITEAYLTIKFDFLPPQEGKNQINYTDEKVNDLTDGNKKGKSLMTRLLNEFLREEKEFFFEFLKRNDTIVEKTIDMMGAFKDYLINISKEYLIKIIIFLESNGGIDQAIQGTFVPNSQILSSFSVREKEVKFEEGVNKVEKIVGTKVCLSPLFFEKAFELAADKKLQFLQSETKNELVDSYFKDIQKIIENNDIFKFISEASNEDLKNDFVRYYVGKSKFDFCFIQLFEEILNVRYYKELPDCSALKLVCAQVLYFNSLYDFFSMYLKLLKNLKFEKTMQFFIPILQKEPNNENLITKLIEALFCYVLSNENTFSFKNLNTLKELLELTENVCREYKIKSINLLGVKTISLFQQMASKEDKKEEDLKSLVNIIRQELQLLKIEDPNKNNTDDFSNIIEREIGYFKKFEGNINCTSLIIKNITEKFSVSKNVDMKCHLVKTVMENKAFLKNSFIFFKSVLGGKYSFQTKENIIREKESFVEKIQNHRNYNIRSFRLMLMEVFKIKIEKYLLKFLTNDKKMDFLTKDPHTIFKIYLENIREFSSNKPGLEELLQITYVKVYLYYYASFFANYKDFQEYGNDLQTNFITDENQQIPIYFSKCLKYALGDSLFNFWKFDFQGRNLQNLIDLFNTKNNDPIMLSPLKMFYINDINKFKEYKDIFNNLERTTYKEKLDNDKKNGTLDFIFQFRIPFFLLDSTDSQKQDIKKDFMNFIKSNYSLKNEKEKLAEKILETNINFKVTDDELMFIIQSFELFILNEPEINTYLQGNDDDFKEIKNFEESKSLLEKTLDYLAVSIRFCKAFTEGNNQDIKELLKYRKKVFINLGIEIKNTLEDPFILISLIINNISNLKDRATYTNKLQEILGKVNRESEHQKYIQNYYNFTKLKNSFRWYITDIEDPQTFSTDNNPLLGYFGFRECWTPQKLKEIADEFSDFSFGRYLSSIEKFYNTTRIVTEINPFINKISQRYNRITSYTKAEAIIIEQTSDSDLLKTANQTLLEIGEKDLFGNKPTLKNVVVNKNHKEKKVFEFYEKYIKQYNSAFDTLKASYSQNSTLRNSINQSKGLKIQDSSIDNIIPGFRIDCLYKDKFYKKFLDILHTNSMLVMEEKDKKANNENLLNLTLFKNYIFNASRIDEDFSDKFLLSKKKMETNQNEFVYLFEELQDQTGGTVLKSFFSRCKVSKGFDRVEAIEREIRNKKISPEEILLDFNYLIYGSEKESLVTKISEVIDKLPKNIRKLLSDTFVKIFKDSLPNTPLREIQEYYEYIEKNYFKDLTGHLSEDYKKEINEELKRKILDTLKNCHTIKKDLLLLALRRYICRNLIGFLKTNDNEKEEFLLDKLEGIKDYWKCISFNPDSKEEADINNFNKEIQKLKSHKIKVSQAHQLYISVQDYKGTQSQGDGKKPKPKPRRI